MSRVGSDVHQNLVLSSRRSRDAPEGSGGPESLRGMSLHPMGDMARRRKPQHLKKLKKRVDEEQDEREAAGSVARKVAKLGKQGNIVDSVAGWEEAVYQPRTKETRQAYETLLTFVQSSIGAQPRHTLASAADEVLAILKDEGVTDPRRKSLVEELLGVSLSPEQFHVLVSVGKRVTDFHDEGGAGDEGLEIMPVVFDGDEDEEAEQQFYVKEEFDDDEDEGEEAAESHLERAHTQGDAVVGKDQAARLAVADVDAYWLQRQISEFEEDAERSRELSEQVLQALGEDDPVTCENQLVQLLDFERFELVRLLMVNRATIVYATLSKRATSEEERERLLQQYQLSVPQAMEVDEEEQGEQGGAHEVESAKVSAARRMLDLKELEFYEGSHLMSNAKVVLPPGTARVPHKGYEEVLIPAPKAPAEAEEAEVVPVTQLPAWAHGPFGNKYFNRLQSAVFQTAFYSPQNMLIAAPTGSGKTNCAMLAMLHTIGMHRREEDGSIDVDAFKIVYIAPMKSLVQEMVLNFGQRLECLGLTVRELSGDQNLTKRQINETQVIVTTPEKWDIVTRRSGDRAYTQLVRLVIIDEVHLLHDERGPVLEAIVARTIRQIEDTQAMTRIVGLSATLPNFKDVAMFLRVPDECIFHFANAHRPVPLEMTFLGINAKKAVQRLQTMNKLCYEQVMLRAGKHQVLVFCHSRKDTAKTARYLRDTALGENRLADVLADYGASAMILQSEVENAKNKDLRDVMPFGFGIHHAGMTREDRTLVEELFADGHLQVLVSTATLAWGVNLPAHCCIIKGTQVYNPEKGRWVELSGLDVMQMLGRAGRPGYDTMGEGVLITSQQELQFYLSLMNQQLPIESQLVARLPDLLLAECVLGSVTTSVEAADWLVYTYLYICMLRNPTLYGVPGEELARDPYLEARRADLVHTAASALARAGLVQYEARAGVIQVTDLGRVAAHFYVGYETMATYNEHMKPLMSDIELFRVFSLSGEFANVSVRSEERLELEKLLERVPIPVKETVQDPAAKVNVLLQTHISNLRLDGFALMSDMVYVTQNAVRLLRALFEIAMKRGWSQLAKRALELAQMTERRMWPVQSPLRQFGTTGLPRDIILALERSDYEWDRMWDLNSQELGDLIRFPDQGKNVFRHVHMFPRLQLAAHVQPVTRSALRVELTLTPDFNWSDKHHQHALGFWVLVEDADQENILHSEYLLLKKRFAQSENNDHIMTMVVPMVEPPPPQYFVTVLADHWLGASATLPISFRHLVPPAKFAPPTELLDLRALSLQAAFPEHPEYAALYREEDNATTFNSIQTQTFKALYGTDANALVCASPGGGLEVCAEFAMLRALATAPQGATGVVVYISPVSELLQLRKRQLEARIGVRFERLVLELTGDTATDLKLLARAHVVVSSPENWDRLSRRWKKRAAVQSVRLFVVDQLQLLSPVLEVVVSRMRYISSARNKAMRIVALAAPVANARDLGDWIGASKAHVFAFHSRVRPVPLEIRLQAFATLDFAARSLSMVRPLVQLVGRVPLDKNVMVYAHSPAHALATARNLASAADEEPRFRLASSDQLASLATGLRSEEARELLVTSGVGVYHELMTGEERELVESLFVEGLIGCLVVSAECCWSVRARAFLVVILGCQRYEGKEHRYVDYPLSSVLQMLGAAGRPGVDERGVAALFCAAPRREYYRKFCFEAMPVESRLDQELHDHLNAEVVTRTIQSMQDAVDYLTWTFLYRRVSLNPNFYGMQGVSAQHLSEFLSQLIEDTLSDLVEVGMVARDEEGGNRLSALNNGMIAAFHSVNYVTIELLGSLSATTRIKAVIEILAAASEFDVIPVRHREPNKLRKLAAHLPMKIQNPDYTEGRTKMNVLLQAHFSRYALSPELAADQARLLTDSVRIIDAIVDVASSEGWLAPALAAMELSQMLVQAMWDNDSQLLQLPHMSEEILGRAKEAGCESIFDLMELEDEQKFALLQGLSHAQLLDVAAVSNRFPSVEVDVTVQEPDALSTTEPVALVVAMEREMDEDEEAEGLGPVTCPLFPGERQEGWWLVVGSKAGALYGIKRIKLPKEQTQVNLEFMPPSEPGTHELFLYLMCDSYVGADQEFPFTVRLTEGVDEGESDE